MKQLPIMQVLPDLKRILRDTTAAILIAEPGAGKTTGTLRLFWTSLGSPVKPFSCWSPDV